MAGKQNYQIPAVGKKKYYHNAKHKVGGHSPPGAAQQKKTKGKEHVAKNNKKKPHRRLKDSERVYNGKENTYAEHHSRYRGQNKPVALKDNAGSRGKHAGAQAYQQEQVKVPLARTQRVGKEITPEDRFYIYHTL
jgi:hypothetical protein